MRKTEIALAALMVLGTGLAIGPRPVAIAPAAAACDPGDKIDNTTANDARRKIVAAGYTDVQMLGKGCDNVWHATASRDGKPGRVALEPSGKIYPEGN
jgi:hypothetical protein